MSTPPPPTPPPSVPPQQPPPIPFSATPPAPPPGGPAPVAPGAPGAKPPLEPLTGFRSALEHTGLPRSVLTYKPRLPSRNWLIFWSVLSSVSYLYYDDRRRCKKIKAEYIAKVEHLGKEVLEGGSLGLVRKVRVLAARWPEDDEADRGAKYFRKYLKPYLVAAGIDYDTLPPPLYGAITRQTHAAILTARRQKLGLEPTPVPLSVPGAIDPAAVEANDLAGGVILIGRPSLKEYMEGLKRGWAGSVDEWVWEKEVEARMKGDGVFEGPASEVGEASSGAEFAADVPTTQSSGMSPTGLSFLNRPQPSLSSASASQAGPQVPTHMHLPPNPLPPQPPLLLVPWTNHLGFQQIPYMIYDFFTEHRKVEEGAKLAYALICGHTRPFLASSSSSFPTANTSSPSPFSSSEAPASTPGSLGPGLGSDLDFDRQAERYFKNDFDDLPARLQKAKDDYYPDLSARLADVRALAAGERELTDAEKKSTKPLVSEEDLRDERKKKELRWRGQVEGWGIVRKEQGVTYEDGWEGWLSVFREPREGEGEGAKKNEEKVW
ncbi:inner membrane protein import complex subunit Tim54-domain-containing protein [Dioszegia hungarica]|uniref:Mitochondrial import inner membrane translocase subunit TIM54 n=1 Tax=Dioszegia hungarica TaxID=4972 RepID=A0AA38H1P8_9TREE|nr:inner membrane protein import complex subunit Tim54-domain-containing protein [Dioszegia hungarica]KAI9632091.1 inner membrane protein import complex subunit Tim54-domain-containing protein [Dioszegia hungarica]